MAQIPIVSYKEILPEAFQDISKDKIVIKLSDLKSIPELSEYISLTQIVEDKETKLIDYDFQTQNKIIEIFLKNYNFLQFINGDYYFNFTKLQELFPHNVYLSQIFQSYTPDLEININDKTYKYYIWSKINDNIKNYVGVLFFTAYYKVENFKEYAIKEYEFFTDVNFDFNDFSMITDMKQFFITEFLGFIKTNNGSYFGSYDFGSNLKYLIQTKYIYEVFEKVFLDIKGFIHDLNILYGNFLELLDFKIDDSKDYEIVLYISVKIKEETLAFRIVV